jgi:hypothetical protein
MVEPSIMEINQKPLNTRSPNDDPPPYNSIQNYKTIEECKSLPPIYFIESELVNSIHDDNARIRPNNENN